MYLAADSFAAAERLLIEALDKAGSLTTLAERGRVVPELGRPEVRELFVRRFRLIYEIDATEIQILAFLHGARDFARWQRDE